MNSSSRKLNVIHGHLNEDPFYVARKLIEKDDELVYGQLLPVVNN